MAFGATGSLLYNDTSALTLTNQGIGDLSVAEVLNYTNATVWCTGLSGTGATWIAAGTHVVGANHTYTSAVFTGTVTGTGARTATPAWSGTAPSGYEINGHEFTSTAGSWVFDTQGTLDVTYANRTASMPSVTPAVNGELYLCATSCNSSPGTGSTSGYVYAVDGGGDGVAYNLSCPAGTGTFPVWTNAENMFGIAVLIQETGAAVLGGKKCQANQAVKRAALW